MTWKGTREYGTLQPGERSTRELLRQSEGVQLLHVMPGWQAAGSCMTWTDETFAVLFTMDGATHGKHYFPAHRERAEQHFERLVKSEREYREWRERRMSAARRS